jgi:Matrixin
LQGMSNAERFILGVSVVTILLGFSVFSVLAYNLSGNTWGNQPSPGHCCASLNVYYSSMDSSAIADWDNGRGAWNSSAALIWYYKVSSSSIQAYELNTNYYTWAGATQCGANIFHNFTYCDTYINYYYVNLYGYPAGERQTITAHELGHVAGLAHHDGCYLMNTSLSNWDQCGINTPTSDDIAGINAMY